MYLAARGTAAGEINKKSTSLIMEMCFREFNLGDDSRPHNSETIHAFGCGRLFSGFLNQ